MEATIARENELLSAVASTELGVGLGLRPRSTRPHVRSSRVRVPFLLVGDLVALLGAFALAAVVRGALFKGDEGPVSVIQSLSSELPYALAYTLAIAGYGLYGRELRRVHKAWYVDISRLLHALVVASIAILAISAGVWRLFGFTKLGWAQVTMMSAVALIALPAFRTAASRVMRMNGRSRSRIVLLGSGPVLQRVTSRLIRLPDVCLVGTVANEPTSDHFHGLWLGPVEELARICDDHNVDRVLVGFGSEESEKGIEVIRQLPQHVRVSFVSGFSELLTWQSQVEDLHGVTLMDVPPAHLGRANRVAKRLMDVVGASLLLMLLAPVFALIALAIKLTSSGPIMFRQIRVGQGGSLFRIYKFRSMFTDAESRQFDLLDANEADGPMFKLRRDPRVTPIGALLRCSSLDELPQLLNVLRGHMALVGPRPLVVEESARLDGWAARRFNVKPGMTGMWQVSGRSDLSFEELRRLDYAYAASWSLTWDVRILCQTLGTVLKRSGAY